MYDEEVMVHTQDRPDGSEAKADWRTWANRIDRSDASAAVSEQLAAWPPLHGVVATYLPMASEISLDRLLDEPSITPVVPRIEDSDEMMMRVYDPEHLVHHRFGYDEPDPSSTIVAPEDIDVVLVPGLAFDRYGGRVGRGKGYYDAFLKQVPRATPRVGVTTDASISERVPMEDHDQRIGWLATESGVRRVGGPVSSDTERFIERAIEVGIAPNIERFPAGTRSSEDAARAVSSELGAIAKSLVFEVDSEPVLVLCSGDRRVDTEKLAAYFGATSARPASRAKVHDITGYPAGGTPAVGHDEPLVTVADPALGRYRRVWSAGGSLDTVYEVRLDRLIAASGAQWADISMRE